MSANTRTADFFVAGGTLRPDAPSYVERPADDELLDLALDGEFCYVLTPRQMGKSSLMTRTARRLRKESVRTAVVDLTGIGTEVSAEQWYQGLITRMKTQLRLPVVPAKWWAERGALSPVQRFTDFLREVVLEETDGPVVIFIDEVDTTLNLDFSDDFFACIRFVYNARASDPVYGRLTFVLLGVAAPADLIKDPGRTPFNIGHRIDLREFSREDARVLQRGLEAIFPERGAAILDRVFHWTNGHPYLTQKLCLAIAEERKTDWTDGRIDALVDELFLSEETQKEANLQFVRNQILTSPQRKQLLALYRRVYRGQKVANDERSLVQSQLKLSGLVKAEDECLQVRNEVYRRVFDSAWIREHSPVNWIPIAVGVPLLAALLAVGAILYNSWVENQFQAHASSFLQESAPGKRLAILADMFETQNLIDPSGYYEYVARERFYGLSREEQLSLFEDESAEGADAVVVAKGLYTTLADVDGTGSTTPLLEAMVGTLSRPGSAQEAATLRAEIEAWLEGRALAGRDPGQALEAYNRAIALNGQNPSTLYERARVLIALSRYQEALDDLDRVVFIARQFEFAAVAPEATATPLPTIVRPVATATATPIPSPLTEKATVAPPMPTREADVSPVGTPTPGVKPSPALTLVPTNTPVPLPTPTPTPLPPSIGSAFATYGQIIGAVRNLIYGSPDLVVFLAGAPDSEYANLRESNLVLTPTPTFTPTPRPVETPTPTPGPTSIPTATPETPTIEYFIIESRPPVDDSDSTLTYEFTAPEDIRLSWATHGASEVTLYFNAVVLGNQEPTASLLVTVDDEGTYALAARTADGVEALAYIQINIPYPDLPPPFNLSGPEPPTVPLPLTWDYDAEHVSDIIGFRVYRFSEDPEHPNGEDNPLLVADIRAPRPSAQEDTFFQWEESEPPTCGWYYFVKALHWYHDGTEWVVGETDATPELYYLGSCTPEL